ncbi:inorganic phosphate transporter [bacterium]|nr:inorganic phosphate transporter [bacterium]
MVLMVVIVLTVLFLSYANGANDNFKGVATLYGSRQLSYKPAIGLAAATTFAGSLCALFLSQGLIRAFSGKGLVPDAVVANPAFMISVGLGAALTVFAAARMGMPISTTHALVGGLAGAGVVLSPSGVKIAPLAGVFLVPLLVSPIIASVLCAAAYPVLSFLRKKAGLTESTCVCVGEKALPVQISPSGEMTAALNGMTITVDDASVCRRQYVGDVLGLSVVRLAAAVHLFLGGAVSFARGLNDTPKICALLLVATAVSPGYGFFAVALAMALGGILGARRIAHTMSDRITDMNLGQGMTAAATTAAMVILASRWGMPVSTTHVSCGSLFGLGAVTRKARWGMIRTIVGAWISTLPVAAALAAGAALILTAAPPALAAENVAPRIVDASAWTLLLQKYVSQNGLVAYSSWKKNDTDVQKLEAYLQAMSRVQAETLSRPDAIAHYLNLYNASMVKLVLDHHPVSSVKKIGGFGGPWKMKFIQAEDRLISLDDIEHGTLRKKYKEPRIHFALVCASTSCPPIRAEAYEGDRIDTQLADQERTFMTDPGRNLWRVEMSGVFSKEERLALGLSSIFKWFGEDFGGEAGVVRRVRPFLDPAARALLDQSRYDVDYLDYDWSLNGK